jgi:hypothetical protein
MMTIPRPLVPRMFVAIALILLFQPIVCGAAHDDDRASAGDWIYVAIVVLGTVALMVVVVVGSRRRVNPHTGLPARLKRRVRRLLKSHIH